MTRLRDSEQSTTRREDAEDAATVVAATTCPDCEAAVTVDGGERYCEECGQILDESAIDRGPDWRTFRHTEYQEQARVGSPMTLTKHDRGLSTTIGWRDRDAGGNALSATQRHRMRRLRRLNSQTADSKARYLRDALAELDRMASALGLQNSVREIASAIYRRALDEDLLLGRSIEGLVTAALRLATRQVSVPRTIDEFVRVSRVEKSRIMSDYRYLSRELGLEVPPLDPTAYISTVATSVNLPSEAERIAREFLHTYCEAQQGTGKDPRVLSAAAVYAASKTTPYEESITQASVAAAVDVTEEAVRVRAHEILQANDITPSTVIP